MTPSQYVVFRLYSTVQCTLRESSTHRVQHKSWRESARSPEHLHLGLRFEGLRLHYRPALLQPFAVPPRSPRATMFHPGLKVFGVSRVCLRMFHGVHHRFEGISECGLVQQDPRPGDDVSKSIEKYPSKGIRNCYYYGSLCPPPDQIQSTPRPIQIV